MTLQEQILKRIRTQHVKPTSKGYFRARDYIMWVLLGVFVAALSLGVGMIIFLLRGTDTALFSRLGLSFITRLAYSIPIFWIAITVILGIAAYMNFRRTRSGYRISMKQFVIVVTCVAIGLGTVVYAFDITKYIDTEAAANIPLYSAVEPLNTSTWFDPARGLLSGSVKIKTSDNSFTLRDQNFDLWTVTGDGVVLVPADFTFQSGDHIKIIGKETGPLQFTAVEIRPFETVIRKDQATTTIGS